MRSVVEAISARRAGCAAANSRNFQGASSVESWCNIAAPGGGGALPAWGRRLIA